MSNINIIYYSKKCSTCFKLMKLLESEHLLKYFRLLCVDDKLDVLPPQITVVPTMIVSSINKPLNAEQCFKWVDAMINFRDNKLVKKPEVNDVNGVSDLEFNNFSDKFTFIQVDDPLEQHFYKYKDEQSNTIYTAPLEKKLNNKEQNEKIKELQSMRYKQDSTFKDTMKKEQIEKINSIKK